MEVHNEFAFLGLALLAWVLPLAFTIWLVVSIRDIRQTLHEIRDALGDGRRSIE